MPVGDVALDANGDLLFGANGDLQAITDPIQAVISDVKSRLLFFLGENPLNVDGDGVPYLQAAPIILGRKNPDLGQIGAILKDVILGAPDMVTVDVMNPVFNSSTRNLTVQWSGLSTFGVIDLQQVQIGIPVPPP